MAQQSIEMARAKFVRAKAAVEKQMNTIYQTLALFLAALWLVIWPVTENLSCPQFYLPLALLVAIGLAFTLLEITLLNKLFGLKAYCQMMKGDVQRLERADSNGKRRKQLEERQEQERMKELKEQQEGGQKQDLIVEVKEEEQPKPEGMYPFYGVLAYIWFCIFLLGFMSTKMICQFKFGDWHIIEKLTNSSSSH